MIRRKIKETFLQSLQFYPITIVTGPRQSGKTTFLKDVLPDWKYVSLEDPDIREFLKRPAKKNEKTGEYKICNNYAMCNYNYKLL